VLVVAAAVLAVGAGFVLVNRGGGASSDGIQQPIPTRGISFLQTVIRNERFGYNLTIPGVWRETARAIGAEPIAVERPSASPALTAAFLLDRRVFTARSPEDWVLPPGSAATAPAWDLDVQVWDRQRRTAEEWSLTFGPCDHSKVTFGPSACTETTETIRGVTAVLTTVSNLRGSQTISYYIEHGDQMLILRYWTDPNVTPPDGVTKATLEGIVRSIGLV
jgi:hypothetical protein